jgi:DNA-binding Lrp family transcriptional regulator
MKFDEIRVYNSKALYVLQEVQPLEFALLSPLNRLNFLIGFLDKNKSEIVESYISELEETYSRKTRESEIELTNIEIKKLISDLPNLKKYPGLARGSLKFFLNLLVCSLTVEMPIAFVLISAETGREVEVEKELNSIPEVSEANIVYGVYDIIVRVECEKMQDLKDAVNLKIRRMDNVQSTVTMIVTEE